MPSNDTTAAPRSSPRPWEKAVVLGIAVLAIVHTILIAAWLAPSSPIRDAIGTSRLATYVDPYFQQSWGMLDPTAQVVDKKLLIRARVLDLKTQKTTVTPWFDMTAAEVPSLLHNIAPARVHLINRRLATNLIAATFGLNDVQQALAQKDYVKQPLIRYSGLFNRAGPYPAAVSTYVLYDQMVTQFASMYAAAKWGGEVTAIQYKVGRLTEPSFAHRAEPTPSYSYFSYGWRKSIPGQEDAQSAFDSYVKK